MSIHFIPGFGQEQSPSPVSARYRGAMARVRVQDPGNPRFPDPQAVDRLELSPGARSEYAKDPSANPGEPFEKRFLEALEGFTDYALHLNGFVGSGNGKEAFLALQVLAQKSGIRLPGNLTENREAVLDAFKEAWGLDDDADVRTIFDRMVRAFGGDTSYGPPEPGMEPDVGAEPPVDVPSGSDTPGDFREALVRFTTGLLAKQGMEGAPGSEDLSRVLNVLAGNLGIQPGDGPLSTRIMAALGIHENADMGSMLTALERAFTL